MASMLGRVWLLSWQGFLQLLRGRFYLSLIVTGLTLLGAALTFDRLSGAAGTRVFIDLGLAFSSVVVAVLVGVTGILLVTREIETKQIHLLISRPIHRGELILGRFLTLAGLAFVSHLLLGLVMAGALLALDGDPLRLLLASVFAAFETLIVAALALFFGVASSSTVSALFVTTGFILGRLSPVLQALIEGQRFAPGPQRILEVVHIVLPQFDRFDLTTWARTGEGLVMSDILNSVAYALLFSAGLLALATFRFMRRDLL